jgi:AcrR family transcriptional regulator
MTRPKGTRNRGYQERRLELVGLLRARLARAGGGPPNLGELAAAAGVSVPTLRHYFGDRDGLVRAVLEDHAPLGEPHLARLRTPSGPFAQSITDAAAYIATGLAVPVVAELHAVGLGEGLGHGTVGPAYVSSILEPLVAAVETRLAAHAAAGEMRDADRRTAALGLIAPLVLAHLHQRPLGGAGVRPLDLEAHRAEHVAAFVRAYRTERGPGGRSGPGGGRAPDPSGDVPEC